MESLYYDVRQPGSYSSPYLLAKYSGEKISNARKWLSTQDAYTIHRQKRKRYKRRKTFVVGIDHLWQIDLVDLTSISVHNDNIHFLLVVIDCFSRYAFVEPVRRKTSLDVTTAFARIIQSNYRQPTYIQSDKGREFVNAVFQKYLAENGISFYTSENDDIKCALVERFNRTLKSKMWKYFTKNHTFRYINVLNDIVNSYNNTYHSTIKMNPAEVTSANQSSLFKRLYADNDKINSVQKQKFKFDIGDQVRLNENKHAFQKSYEHNWSKEIFRIKNRIATQPHTYEVVDLMDEPIKGRFYAQELQKIRKHEDELFEVDKVIKTRIRNGKKEYFVRWIGYSPKFDSWVDNIIT